MSEKTTVEPEVTDEVAKGARMEDAIADAFAKMHEDTEDAAVAKVRQALESVRTKRTPEQRETVKEVIEDQSQRVPARSGARAQLASLSDARYRALPEKYQFRNADQDYTCQRWLRAMKHKDYTVLREIAAEDRHARAALAEGDSDAVGAVFDGTGGQLVPLPLSNYLLEVVYKEARMRRFVRTFQAGVGGSLRIPVQDAASTVAWKAEGAAIVAGEPTAGTSVNLQLQKLTCLADITEELLEDSAFNVGQWLTMDVGNNMAAVEDEAMYSSGAGAGSDQPIGLEANDSTVTAGPAYYVPISTTQDADFEVAAAITAAHLVKMFFALPEKERRNAIWSAGDQVAAKLSQLADDQGRPILNFQNSPQQILSDADAGGQVGTIFGRPFVNMPGNEAATPGVPTEDENRLYFWNPMRCYAILEKGQIRARASEDFKFNTDVTTFRFTRRVDGQPIGNTTAGIVNYVYTGSIIG